ncbi:transglycosylase domain-containing protein [Alishewanella tabrizica]|uniref:Glycosyl transferase family 51 domain-containing protein n=1 Tax=Alishewanella tabrizica TaxID=671278 RepID=A0ABQ2WWV5_9ALTE|nr:transglycosylase domain-containing protein [Alishewanella tabrizica]GGW73523.1 hypothetical protein GCM10008111_31830 [Alishewanella tabrizica]
MYLKVSAKILLSSVLIVIVYLTIALTWASLSVEYLLTEEAIANEESILTIKQNDILLKIKDPTFYEHAGLDLSQGQGLTTITSSLARDIFLFRVKLPGIKGSFQSFYRGVFNCCKKIDLGRDMMALILNKNLTKELQLQLYVSSSYMGSYDGRQIRGLPAAAETYFNKPLAELSDDEFIALVAMLKAPNYFHPEKGAKHLESRIYKIKKILAGTCKPDGWFDTEYKHCTSGA